MPLISKMLAGALLYRGWVAIMARTFICLTAESRFVFSGGAASCG